MEKRVVLIFLFAILICSSFVLAEERFEKTTVTSTIIKEFNQPAHFIVNVAGIPFGYYQLYTLNDVLFSPKGFFLINTTNVDVYVFPTNQLIEKGYFPLAYKFNYNFKKDTGEDFEDAISIRVVALKDAIEILPSYASLESDSMKLIIQNKENAEVKNIKARFSSPVFDEEKTFDLLPLKKTEISINLNNKLRETPAGTYVLNADFSTDRGAQEIESKFYIVEKKSIESQDESKGFFIQERTLARINTGNVPESVEIILKKNILTRLFTTFNIPPTRVSQGFFSVNYIWAKELGPSEVLSVEAKTNYIWPVFIVLFIVALAWGFMRYLSKSARISKSVSYVKTRTGAFALRVTINIHAKKNLHNVSLIDRIPAMMKVFERFPLRPSKFDLATRKLEWELGSMKAGEERVVSYVVYSKSSMLGKFSLPEALLVYEKNGNIQEISSNKVFFSENKVEESKGKK